MLTYVTINLFDSPAQTLVNTVNTVGVMGKGIAADFKKLYPEMYERYRRLCQEEKLDVGMLYIYRTPNKIIVNFPTKKHWRQRSRVEYIEAGLEKFVTHYGDYGISSVSFPQLGCGHGELDWEKQVHPVMERHLSGLPIPVYIHLYPKPSGFIPERLNDDYTRQIRLERRCVSIERLWQDLRELVPDSLPLDPALKFIACRSAAERQTLLHLLPADLRRRVPDAVWGTITLHLDDALAFAGSLTFEETPF